MKAQVVITLNQEQTEAESEALNEVLNSVFLLQAVKNKYTDIVSDIFDVDSKNIGIAVDLIED